MESIKSTNSDEGVEEFLVFITFCRIFGMDHLVDKLDEQNRKLKSAMNDFEETIKEIESEIIKMETLLSEGKLDEVSKQKMQMAHQLLDDERNKLKSKPLH
ncbi:MAG: hypothetical protein ACSHWN_11455 [Methylophilaceae bacterium]